MHYRPRVTPQQIAFAVMEHVEACAEADLLATDDDLARLRARWPAMPAELWTYCGGERTPVLFTLARAAMARFPADDEANDVLGGIAHMCLAAPSTILWQADHEPPRDPRVDPAWWRIASGIGQDLLVDLAGAVHVFTNDADTEVELAHASFDVWMAELAAALSSGAVRIEPAGDEHDERIVSGHLEWPFGAREWYELAPR